MATQVTTTVIDDLDGSEAAEIVRFAFDGVDYTIDLSERNTTKMRKALDPFITAAMRTNAGGRATRKVTQVPMSADGAAERAAIRGWARKSKRFPTLTARGKIPAEVVEAYRAAHGE